MLYGSAIIIVTIVVAAEELNGFGIDNGDICLKKCMLFWRIFLLGYWKVLVTGILFTFAIIIVLVYYWKYISYKNIQ